MSEETFGPYRLQGVIGRGGMGEVHRAFDSVRNRRVALKLLPPLIAADPEYVARFRAEAALAAKLREPHIIPVHDFGEIDGRLFIDMRLVEGLDLAGVLRRDGALPPARAIDIVSQVAAALDSAHEQGLVHRDIKPANILMAGDFAYVADFGIARCVDAGSTSLTMTGAMVGSLSYMAPERLTAGHGDHRVDVYSLGCLLFEVLTGRAPFPVTGTPALLYAHVADAAAAPVGPGGGAADGARRRGRAGDGQGPGAPLPERGCAGRGGAARARARRRARARGRRHSRAARWPARPVRPRRGTRRSGRRAFRRCGGDCRSPWPRWTVLLTAAGSGLSLSTSEAAEVVVLEARHTAGANPFMPAVGDDSDAVLPAEDAGGTVVGGEPGIFGGTQQDASCDPAQMVTFLESHPDRADAWAATQGIPVAEIPDYVGRLTPVELRSDTAVTNHGLQDGVAVPYQAVLQAGTAVLVDEFGVPRAKCYCGNPLLPPQPQPALQLLGGEWPGFGASRVTTVVPAAVPVAYFRLVDQRSGKSFDREPHVDGPRTRIPTRTGPRPMPTRRASTWTRRPTRRHRARVRRRTRPGRRTPTRPRRSRCRPIHRTGRGRCVPEPPLPPGPVPEPVEPAAARAAAGSGAGVRSAGAERAGVSDGGRPSEDEPSSEEAVVRGGQPSWRSRSDCATALGTVADSAEPHRRSASAAGWCAVKEAAVDEGDTFGPYRLQRLLGRGRAGEVFETFDVARARTVALRVLPAVLAGDGFGRDFRRRFHEKAELAARLTEPHVVPMHDFGEIDGRLYLDMRLVPGTDPCGPAGGAGPTPAAHRRSRSSPRWRPRWTPRTPSGWCTAACTRATS